MWLNINVSVSTGQVIYLNYALAKYVDEVSVAKKGVSEIIGFSIAGKALKALALSA